MSSRGGRKGLLSAHSAYLVDADDSAVFRYACTEALLQQSARVAYHRAGAPGFAVGGWGRGGKKPFGGVGEGVSVTMAFLPAPDEYRSNTGRKAWICQER